MSATTPTRSPRRGAGRDWRRRLLRHHAPLALASVVVLVLFLYLPALVAGTHGDITGGTFPRNVSTGGMGGGVRPADPVRQLTVATGYLALGLLALTLLIGPANLLRRPRRQPVSSYLRRDVGTWTAITSVAHVVLGFQAHGTGQIIDYFIRAGKPLLNSFGLANWTGLAALIIVLALQAVSTNRALRELRAATWKDLQRLNYTLFVLVVLHAYFYGALLQPTSPLTVLLMLTVTTVVVAQAVGIGLWRRNTGRIRAATSTRDSGPTPDDGQRPSTRPDRGTRQL
jgi:methionine sulfoxide reductase heme-binding subunit